MASAFLSTPAFAGTGANIDESAVVFTFYVDPNTGNDSTGSGTVNNPYRTLGRALDRADGITFFGGGGGSKIILQDGVYRERATFFGQRNDSVTVIEAANPGQAILSGSDVFTNWEAVGDGTYRTPWNDNWGVAAPIWPRDNGSPRLNELGRRSELVHVNGQRYTQVGQQSQLDSNAIKETGGYWVDGNATNGFLYVRPKDGTDFDTALKEVSTRNETLLDINSDNVVVRGLTIQHQAGVNDSALTLNNSNNVLIENVTVRNNNGGGVSLSSSIERSDYTVRDSRFEENGFTGNGATRVNNLLFENVTAEDNNWRGLQGGLTGWSVAGIKHLFIDDGTYQNVATIGNAAHGIWFDTENDNITVTGLVSRDNLRYGVYLEASDDDITLADAQITGNEIGVFIANQMFATIRDSIIVDNGEQVTFDQRKNQQLGPSGDRGNRFLVLEDNLIGAYESWQEVLINNNFNPEGERWLSFLETLSASGNTYFHPDDPLQFATEGRPQISFQDWISALEPGQESGSTFTLGVVAIPEPASGALLIFGLTVLCRRPTDDRDSAPSATTRDSGLLVQELSHD
ncbi:MAG: right-handed parallel beta-helix repeat-containing protein [Planctomycetota bacterium]